MYTQTQKTQQDRNTDGESQKEVHTEAHLFITFTSITESCYGGCWLSWLHTVPETHQTYYKLSNTWTQKHTTYYDYSLYNTDGDPETHYNYTMQTQKHTTYHNCTIHRPRDAPQHTILIEYTDPEMYHIIIIQHRPRNTP